MGDFVLMFPLALWGCPLLALAGVGCLALYRGPHRRKLVWTAAVFLTALTLFFGGNILLGFFRLTWRNLPAGVLCLVLLLSGWTGIVLTLMCILPQKWKEVAPVLRVGVKAAVSFFAGLVLLVSLWFGPMLLAFAYGSRDQVVDYQGQRLVERMEGFLAPDCNYYVYHGPLLRGTERVYAVHIGGGSD